MCFFIQELKLGHCHDDVRSLGLLIQDRLISVMELELAESVMELELAEAGKPGHLAY